MFACIEKSSGKIVGFHIEGIFGMDYFLADPSAFEIVEVEDSGDLSSDYDATIADGAVVRTPKVRPVDRVAVLEAELAAVKLKQAEHDTKLIELDTKVEAVEAKP